MFKVIDDMGFIYTVYKVIYDEHNSKLPIQFLVYDDYSYSNIPNQWKLIPADRTKPYNK